MKKIKLIIILLLCSLLICLLTGCTAQYDLKFNNNTIREKVTIDASDSNMTSDEIEEMLSDYTVQDSSSRQSHSVTFNEKNKKIELSNTYQVNNYASSLLLRQCYTAYNFFESDDYYDLTTSNQFNCNPFDYMVIDEVQIRIKTNHKVMKHNADLVENNTYIWVIDKDNKEDKPIQIRFSKETKSSYIGLIILGIIVIIVAITMLIAMIQQKKNNNL